MLSRVRKIMNPRTAYVRLISLLLFISPFLLHSFICDAQVEVPKFRFEKKSIKFGKVSAGKILSFDYVFENTGTQPLVISNIKVSCGCTKPEWPKEPVFPGKKDTIHVEVDTKSMIGWQDRTLEVYSNVKNSPTKLRFKVMVESKKQE